jgi:hypothetical protein
MTQGYKVRGALGSLNGRNSGDTQNVSFVGRAAAYTIKGLGLHMNFPNGHGHPPGGGLIGNVDHVRLAGGVEMIQHQGVGSLENE